MLDMIHSSKLKFYDKVRNTILACCYHTNQALVFSGGFRVREVRRGPQALLGRIRFLLLDKACKLPFSPVRKKSFFLATFRPKL